MHINKNTKLIEMNVEINNGDIKFNKTKCITLSTGNKFTNVIVEKFDNSFFSYARGHCLRFVREAEGWLKEIVIEGNYNCNEQKTKMVKQREEDMLNEDQAAAFQKCISGRKFCLVEGLPGTGKTQLILKLMHYFYRIGQRVLVTAYTNQALTNILRR
jgi:DNA replication protein DnaC